MLAVLVAGAAAAVAVRSCGTFDAQAAVAVDAVFPLGTRLGTSAPAIVADLPVATRVAAAAAVARGKFRVDAVAVAALEIRRAAAAIAIAAALGVPVTAVFPVAAFLVLAAADGNPVPLVTIKVLDDAEVAGVVPVALATDELAVVNFALLPDPLRFGGTGTVAARLRLRQAVIPGLPRLGLVPFSFALALALAFSFTLLPLGHNKLRRLATGKSRDERHRTERLQRSATVQGRCGSAGECVPVMVAHGTLLSMPRYGWRWKARMRRVS
jgi:hypothetical protein